jgi:hypothetical protein
MEELITVIFLQHSNKLKSKAFSLCSFTVAVFDTETEKSTPSEIL